MAGRIPRQFLDDLIDRTDIAALVGTRVKLKRSGVNLSGRCPFHEEKSPSFYIYTDNPHYHCFGCGAHGNVIDFVMHTDNLSFTEAVEHLAQQAGMTLPDRAEDKDAEQRRQLTQVLEACNRFFQQQLAGHPQKQRALDYLARRGFTPDIQSQFGIGYAPPGWQNLLNAQPGKIEQLAEAGMIVPGKKGHYDRFRDRIMFPIRNRRGHCIGFGGRCIGDEKPKYLNSPETLLYNKRRELYGLHEARQAGSFDHLLVVEGYLDVISLAQFGVTNSVATLGTATTSQQLTQLFRNTSRIVFCFDGDNAGTKAAGRALEALLPLMSSDRRAEFLFLPAGEDPDTLIRKLSAAEFRQRVAGAIPLSDYFFRAMEAGTDRDSVERRSQLAHRALSLIKTINDPIFRQLMERRLAEVTGLDAGLLKSTAEQSKTPPAERPATASEKQPPHQPAPPSSRAPVRRPAVRREASQALRYKPESLIFTCLYYRPDLAGKALPITRLEPDTEVLASLQAFISSLTENHIQNRNSLLGLLSTSEESRRTADLLLNPQLIVDPGALESEFGSALAWFERKGRILEFEQLRSRAATTGLSDREKKRFSELLILNQRLNT